MTNFILQSPDVIFAHLPKTGGTSVRQALGNNIKQRFFGHIPREFSDLLCFSIIREPKARFLSAFRMFKYGNLLKGDYYSEPRWPDLTISDVLDVLEDPWTGYDRSQRNLRWNLKHHTIPQTHPFNCLKHADRLLRFETLAEDFESLCNELNVSLQLPKLRESINENEHEAEWGETDNNRFQAIFADDYEALGYIQGNFAKKDGPLCLKTDDAAKPCSTVFDFWPSYFSDRKILLDAAEHALPLPSVQLEPFLDEVIPGRPTESWAGRSENLIDHFHKIQPEFAGASRLSHLLACTIVVLRRNPDCENARLLLWRILDEQFDAILSEMSLRWLVAVADTLADFGRTTSERSVALNASVFANSTKLYESELMIFHPKRPWPPKKRISTGGVLFDGMRTYWTKKGDLIENMFDRSLKLAEIEPIAGKLLLEVIERLKRGPTVYRRFTRIAGEPDVPMLEEDVKRRLQRIAKRRL